MTRVVALIALFALYSWTSCARALAADPASQSQHAGAPVAAPSTPPDFSTDIAAAKDLQRRGRSHDAIALLLKDHRSNPADRDVTVALAQTYSYAGDQGSAIALLDTLLAQSPDDGDARVILAQAYAFNHDYAAAENQYGIVLKATPDDEDAQVGLGQTYTFEGKFAQAQTLLSGVLAHDPKNSDARVGLAGAESYSGDYEKARADYRAVLADQPDNTDALVGLASVEYWLGDVPAAVALDNRALALDPGDSDARDLERQLHVRVAPQLVATSTTSRSNDGSTFDYQLEGRYYANPATSYGLVDEVYGIANGGAWVRAHRFGIVATYTGADRFGADLRLVNARYASSAASSVPSATDDVFTLSDASGPFSYSLGTSNGGVDGSVQAYGQRTAFGQQSALVRINSIFGSVGYQRHANAVDLQLQSSTYNDGNRYHQFSADVSHELGFGATLTVTPDIAVSSAGFTNSYTDPNVGASPGYYDFDSQRVVLVTVTAQKQMSDRFSVGTVAGIGENWTVVPSYLICVPGYCPPPTAFASPALLDQHLEPYFDYEGDRFSFAGAYYDDHFAGAGKGAAQIQPYAANTLDLTFSIRLP